MKKVVAIIQARVRSSRLPEKVLLDIAGKPMLWHVIERIRKCTTVDEVVVATTTNSEDQPILELAIESGIPFFAGDEHDVLDRYYQAAKKFEAGIIVRITADCPLIDPNTIDRMVKKCVDKNADYVCSHPDIPSFETGAEVITLAALAKVKELGTKDYHKEHVTIYLRENPGIFNIQAITPDPLFQRDDIRLTVDRNEDLTLLREIYDRLYSEGEVISLKKVIEFLDNHPELIEINQSVEMSEVNKHAISEELKDKMSKALSKHQET